MRYSFDPKDPNFPERREDAKAKKKDRDEMREKMREVLKAKREKQKKENLQK